jgi:hypothetical protein
VVPKGALGLLGKVMAENRLIVTLYLANGITHMSDPIWADEVECEAIMNDVREALEGTSENGVLQFVCNEKTVLIRNSAVLSSSFEYREFDEEDLDPVFAGA